jgi:hypothetical protein
MKMKAVVFDVFARDMAFFLLGPQNLGTYVTQPERVFENDTNKSVAQRSRIATQTREKRK